MQVQSIPLNRITKGPIVRKALGDLTELQASISEHQLIHPILVRPMAKDFELVVGERRLEATRLNGAKTIDATVRELDEVEARAIQMVENFHREDASPWDEAESIRWLVDETGLSVPEVAARLACSESKVRQRMTLLRVAPGIVDQVRPLPVSIALVIAQIAGEKEQERALDLYQPGESASEFQREVQWSVLRLLQSAPFDTADADLVPAAGACIGCPKRTCAQGSLFEVRHSQDDRCLDRQCFETKTAAAFEDAAVRVRAAGGTVASASETKKLLPHGQVPYGGPVQLGGTTPHSFKKWSSVVRSCNAEQKREIGAATTLVQDANGRPHELVDRAKMRSILAGNAKTKKYADELGGSKARAAVSPQEAKRKLDAKIDRETSSRFVAAIVEQVEREGASGVAILALVLQVGRDCVADVAIRRGWADKKTQEPRAALTKAMSGLTEAEQLALAVEVLALNVERGWAGKEALDVFGVDRKGIRAEVSKEIRAAEAERAKKKSTAKKKTPAKKKPAKKARAKA